VALRSILESVNVSGYRYNLYDPSLTDLVKLARLTPKKMVKSELVKELEHFYDNPNNIKAVWEELSLFEKACVADYISSGGYLFKASVEHLAKQYKCKVETLQSGSRIGLFFIKGDIPECVNKIIVPYIEKSQGIIECKPVDKEDLEELYLFEADEHLFEDLIAIVKFASTGKLKIAKASQCPTKPVMKKMNEFLYNKEYVTDVFMLEEITKPYQAMRLYGLYQILRAAQVLDVEETTIIMGVKANAFLMSNHKEQMELLLQGYINNSFYNEIERIRGERFETYLYSNFPKVRKALLQAIGGAPVDIWISLDSVSEMLFKYNRTFLMDQVRQISIKPSGYSYYGNEHFEGDWDRLERAYMDIVFLEGLVPLGIVEVAVQDSAIEDEYTGDYIERLEVVYFKLTKLGAYLLGASEDYEDPTTKDKAPNDLWVDEEMRIIVGESAKRHQHEIFFERFAEKQQEGELSFYPLNFFTALNAFNAQISLKEIELYLQKEGTKPLPDYVGNVICKWEEDQNKITIRNVTIIESEDEAVLAELLASNAIVKNGGKWLSGAVQINGGCAQKVKKEIEKYHYFCNVRIDK